MSGLPALLDLMTASDALPARLLRLAVAAALALPVLAWLSIGVTAGQSGEPWARRGRHALIAGAIGMPLLLALAALWQPWLKLLLFVPADLVFVGTVVAAWRAGRRAHPVEAWGWRLVVAGMALGLMLGAVAFGGPLPTPEVLDAYRDPARCVARGVHVGAILLGMAGIAAGRTLRARAAVSVPVPGKLRMS